MTVRSARYGCNVQGRFPGCEWTVTKRSDEPPSPATASIVDGLVHQRAQLGPEGVRDRGEQLGHEDDEEVLGRVHPEGGAGGAAPVEVAGRPGEGGGGGTLADGEAEPEADALEAGLAEAAHGHVLEGRPARQVVDGHEL